LRVGAAVDDDDAWGKTAGDSDLLALIRGAISADCIFMTIPDVHLSFTYPPPSMFNC